MHSRTVNARDQSLNALNAEMPRLRARLMLLALAACAAVVPHVASPITEASDALVLLLAFEGSTANGAAAGNVAVLFSGAAYAAGGGLDGRALRLTEPGYADVDCDIRALVLPDATLGAWVRITGGSSGAGLRGIAGNGDEASRGRGVLLSWQDASAVWVAAAGVGSVLSSGVALAFDRWTFVAVVYSRTGLCW